MKNLSDMTEPELGQYDFLGTPGDNGVILGGYYTDGMRTLMCMADHATKGIWLTDPSPDAPSPMSRDEEIAMGDDCPNWYGTRAEFDAYGWRYTGEFADG